MWSMEAGKINKQKDGDDYGDRNQSEQAAGQLFDDDHGHNDTY